MSKRLSRDLHAGTPCTELADMNRKVFCTSAQHPVYFYVSSSSGQLYSLICDIHDNGRYRPNAARSTYPGKKNRVGQKSPQVYHRKPYHLFGSGVVICNFPLFQYEAGSYPLSGMATVSIHREQVMISGAQPTANHRRQLLEGLSVSSQNPQSNPTHLLSETINSKLQLTIDERRHPLMSRGLPALVFGWQLSRYVGTHSALWRPQ